MKTRVVIPSLFLLALVLRLHSYAVYPQRGTTSDEYAFAFQGISLLTRGVPTAWSAIPLYQNRSNLTIDGLYFPLVTPYMDHPPLFGLLVGAWAVLLGERTFESVRLATIRVIPIALSLLSALLLFLLADRLYGRTVARWSLAVFATATLFVVNSRVVVAESLLTPLWLTALWKTARISRKWGVGVLGLMSAAALLTKALGIVVFLSVAALLLQKKAPVKQIALFAGITLLGAIALYAYGRAYDGELFWAVQRYQGMTRVLGPRTVWAMLGTPIIVNTIYYDGWYFWGTFALFAAGLDIRKNLFLVLPAFLYALLLIVSVNETDIHGWYYLPLFPFLAIAGARSLVDAIENRRWTIFLWALLVGAHLTSALYAVPFGLTPTVYRLLIGIAVGLGLLSLRSMRVGYGVAAVSLVATAAATLQYVHP